MNTVRTAFVAAACLVLGAGTVGADGPLSRRVARVEPAPVVLPAPVPVRPMTHAEFARVFQPLPGTYEVVLMHPDTCCPVRVCFTLPAGCCLKKVRVERRELEFDYGRREVEIRFERRGGVRVEYRN